MSKAKKDYYDIVYSKPGVEFTDYLLIADKYIKELEELNIKFQEVNRNIAEKNYCHQLKNEELEKQNEKMKKVIQHAIDVLGDYDVDFLDGKEILEDE